MSTSGDRVTALIALPGICALTWGASKFVSHDNPPIREYGIAVACPKGLIPKPLVTDTGINNTTYVEALCGDELLAPTSIRLLGNSALKPNEHGYNIHVIAARDGNNDVMPVHTSITSLPGTEANNGLPVAVITGASQLCPAAIEAVS